MKKKTYAEQLEDYALGLAKCNRTYSNDSQRKSVKKLFEKLAIYHHRVTKEQYYTVKIMSSYKHRHSFTEDYRKHSKAGKIPFRSESMYFLFGTVIEGYIIKGTCIPETPIVEEIVIDTSNGFIWIDTAKGRGELHILDESMNTVKVIPWVEDKTLTSIEAIDKWSNLKLHRIGYLGPWFKHP